MGLDLPNLTEALSEIVSKAFDILRDFLESVSEALNIDTEHVWEPEVVYTFATGETIGTAQETQQTLSQRAIG
jgi:hypothetical protein